MTESTKLATTDSATEADLRRAAIILKVVDGLAQGLSIKDSCKEADITPASWRLWRADGLIQQAVNTRFDDMTTGVKGIISDSLVAGMSILADIAQGKKPRNTAITGVLSPRDVIAANTLLLSVWEKMGGSTESRITEQRNLLDKIKEGGVNINTVQIQVINVGDKAQPRLVPVGAGIPQDILDGTFEIITKET